MNKFKIGDIIIGTSYKYNFTSLNSINKVTSIINAECIEVKVLKPSSKCRNTPNYSLSYGVNPMDFQLAPIAARVLYGS